MYSSTSKCNRPRLSLLATLFARLDDQQKSKLASDDAFLRSVKAATAEKRECAPSIDVISFTFVAEKECEPQLRSTGSSPWLAMAISFILVEGSGPGSGGYFIHLRRGESPSAVVQIKEPIF